ncbi:MAG TPA: isoprenylcysteine carboxylmethyltransferase family protein [Planctomycetota bacterium]|jgi:protein-S-isoprenylcysteine O-methyltransferase Ste14|nr:isoprenylcysteine carboxylmethyltransferase family protein [Planctomycetota bacterium]
MDPGNRASIVLILEDVLFTALVPGTVALFVPYRILASSGKLRLGEGGVLRFLGFVPILVGCAVYLWSIVAFARTGGGTPAPIDPPKTLVVRGPYRYTRNPMYLAVLLVILGESLLFASGRLLAYAALLLAVFYSFVLLYEEPTLRRRFGMSCASYCARVPRWLFVRKAG